MKRVVALLVALAVSGCLATHGTVPSTEVAIGGRVEKSDPLTVRATPSATPGPDGATAGVPLQVVWKYAMRHFEFIPWAPLETAGPTIAGDRVYVASARGQALYSLDARTGSAKWVFHPRGRVEATPAVGGGRAYIATAKGMLFGVSADTGDEVWHADIAGVSTSRLLYDETADRVVVPTGDNRVHCVDAKTGTEVWTYRRDPPSDLTISGTSSPAKVTLATGDAYVVGFSDGTVVAIKAANGTPVWEQRLVAAGRFRDIDGPIATDATRIYVTAYGDALYALERESGRVIWSAPPGGVTGVVLGGDRLFHGTDSGDVVARDPADGREIWRWHVPAGAPTTPVVSGEYIFVASSSKTLYALRADNGVLAWTFDPGYRVAGANASPAVSGRRVYLVSNVGTVYAFEPSAADSHYIGTWDSGTHRR